MCGIAGIVSLTDHETGRLSLMQKVLPLLRRRGPDANGIYQAPQLVLGHTRLAILDTSASGAQPMTDAEGRFTIIFNGEFFNYREHREELIRRGVQLHSTSDTEVILHWYKLEGAKCLERINGFFALAIYDAEEKTLFVARDRMGVKPLFYYYDEKQFCFASEMKALMAMGIPKEIDRSSLATYLQLNYIPCPHTIFKSVHKLETGHYLMINQIGSTAEISKVCYYQLEKEIENQPKINSYEAAKKEFRQLMTEAVNRRMIADVPLGAFLSGGIDSSVVTGIAAKQTDRLKTFSIGFKDEPMFDETGFALSVSKKHNTEHTVFNISNDDLFNIVFEVLDYLDEPFGDSSALNVYLLSRETKKKVTVALSGDGADELFGGYNKHMAEWRIRNRGWMETLLINSQPVWQWLPQSRNSKLGNTIRQFNRFATGAKMNPADRYWSWASFGTEKEAMNMLKDKVIDDEYFSRKKENVKFINGASDLNDVFRNDMSLVLVNDMLVKVDLMSMANSLEVRSPFVDYKVAEFAFKIPSDFKINKTGRKKIIKDTFSDLLPAEVLQRNKQGFEVPLLKWFRNELRSLIDDDLLAENFILRQGIFNPESISQIKHRIFNSSSPGEAVHRIWGLIVFQYWWKKNMDL